MWISTEAMTQGQAAFAGSPVNGSIASADQRRADRHQDRGGERIEPALDRGVPAGMAQRGKQHGGEDEGVHLVEWI